MRYRTKNILEQEIKLMTVLMSYFENGKHHVHEFVVGSFPWKRWKRNRKLMDVLNFDQTGGFLIVFEPFLFEIVDVCEGEVVLLVELGVIEAVEDNCNEEIYENDPK